MTNEEIAAYYERLLEHSAPWRWGDHGSRESRDARMRAVVGVMAEDHRPKTVLDIGCGTGTLADFLAPGDYYIGVDLSKALIARAGIANRSRAMFHVADGFALQGDLIGDYVVACGTFQFAGAFDILNGIGKMYRMARTAIAVSFLTKADETAGETENDPTKIFEYCRALSPRVALRCDYLPNDATVYVYR